MNRNQQYLPWRPALGVFAVCLLGLVGLPAAAQSTFERDGPADRLQSGPELGVEEDRTRVVYNLVGSGYRVTSYDNLTDMAPSQVRVPYHDAITNDDDADRRFVLFDGTSRVAHLSTHTKRALLAQFETGKLVIGAEGTGRDLKRALGLIDQDLYEAGTTTGGEGLWVLLHRSPNGHLNELTIAAPHDQASLEDAFGLAKNWYNRNKAFVDPSATEDGDNNPWLAIHNFEYSGTMTGEFEGVHETAGTYTFLTSVYFLANAASQDTAYYRIDFGTVVSIDSYEMTGEDFGDTSGNCGWWNQSQRVAVTVTTPGGQWWPTGFMPDTTVGSTSTSFSIGGDIGVDGPTATAEYSKSYGTPDVTIEVESNSVDEWLIWDAALMGCSDYGAYPDYDGAKESAHSTYSLDPSFIAAVPSNSPLNFETIANGDDYWSFLVQKVHLKCGFACLAIEHSTEDLRYRIDVNPTCSTTACS